MSRKELSDLIASESCVVRSRIPSPGCAHAGRIGSMLDMLGMHIFGRALFQILLVSACTSPAQPPLSSAPADRIVDRREQQG